jgi:addiction module HigA family antidote
MAQTPKRRAVPAPIPDLGVTTLLPANRAPTHPGKMLLEEFLEPLGLTQAEAARRLGISFVRLTQVVHGKRPVTTDTALRLARVLGTSPELWLNLQATWDLWHALRSPEAKKIAQLEPIATARSA